MNNFYFKFLIYLAFITIIGVFLSSCSSNVTYPYLEYRNSSYNFDVMNKVILIREGYEISNENPYNVVEDEDGYSIVVHLIKTEVND